MIAQDAKAIDSPILQLAAEYRACLKKDPNGNANTLRAYFREVDNFAEFAAEKLPGGNAGMIEAEHVDNYLDRDREFS